MKGLIFSVKKYSIHDGPGIRVTFFMKGCKLSCWWCHNPEGISPDPEKVVQIDKIGEKEFQRIEEVGKLYSVDDVLEILEGERIFITQSKGGVTFSGGEPMMQHDFLLEALKSCKKAGYHTAVDTSGYAPSESFNRIIPYTDLFLFDIKHLNDEKHLMYTGVSNSLILENLHLLIDSGCDLMIRIPVIPGVNDDAGNMNDIKRFLLKNKADNLKKICLLPYHKTGSSKYKKFNIPYRMIDASQPSSARMKELKDFFSDVGVKVKTGG
ncbi:MAG TPA: glycyl-radical enzyme activating protein [Bacteroidales bacterium]|nr:glycyl-radical enzyme activating protein [Bacteroidales bacterium]